MKKANSNCEGKKAMLRAEFWRLERVELDADAVRWHECRKIL